MAFYAYAYNGVGSRPASGPQPGTRALLNHAISHFGAYNLGIYNPRDVCGNPWPSIRCALSFHAEGRAGDAGYPVDRKRWPKGHPDGSRLAAFLVDTAGELGVQEVIWAGHRWDVRTRRWVTYAGRSDHFDHVHFSQCWAAALGLTASAIAAINAPKPTTPPEEDDDMALAVKSKDDPRWWAVTAIGRRHLINRQDAAQEAFLGLLKVKSGDSPETLEPFIWPQEMIDKRPRTDVAR